MGRGDIPAMSPQRSDQSGLTPQRGGGTCQSQPEPAIPGSGPLDRHDRQPRGGLPCPAGHDERAAALHGRTQGAVYLQTLTDPAQAFYDRDMYVFALDGQGTYQAFGGNPAKVNTRVQDIPGIAGDPLVRAIIAQAERGAGWVEYDITNPTSGAVQTKMSYVQKVGPWYVSCGVYKSLAA